MKEEIDTDYTCRSTLIQDNRHFEKEFIETYGKLPLLWNTKHADYTNKYKRNDALDILLEVMKKWNRPATRYDVRKKINILRSCYRKDLRRQLSSQTITPEGEIAYEYRPSSWKFYALNFLNGENIKLNNDSMTEVSITESYQEQATDDSVSGNDEEPGSHIEVPFSETSVHTFTQIPTKKKRVKHMKVEYSNDKFYEGTEEREYEAIGANVSCKLKRMDAQQRYHAELLINKVLINGLKNNLTDETDLTEVYKA